MRFFLLTSLFFSLFTHLCFAQWEIINEGFRGSLNTIDFVNEHMGWIAGENGTLLNTINGGNNWNSIDIIDSISFYQIDFINDSIGWAVGSLNINFSGDAIIIKTTDGGNNWSIQKQMENTYLSAIYALDENNVYAVHDKIYKTTNGGTDWIDVTPSLIERYYYSLWFINPDSGIVVGHYSNGDVWGGKGVILRTTNAGTSWNETIVNEFNIIGDLQFSDNKTGYFLAYKGSNYFLCKTEDMCETWTVKRWDSSGCIVSYQFLNNDTAYAVMSDSSVVKSTDGGESWYNIQSFKCNLSQIYFCNSETGFLFGPDMLYQSKNAGNTWETKEFSYPFNNVCFIDKNNGLISYVIPRRAHWPWYKIFSTTNGGVSWNLGDFQSGVLNSITFINDSVGFYITSLSNEDADIYKSTNAGKDWFSDYNDDFTSSGYDFEGYDISFLNEDIGWAVGYCVSADTTGPAILITRDSGSNWTFEWKYPGIAEGWAPLLNSVCNSGTTACAVGTNGMIVKNTPQNGWKIKTAVTDLPLNKVFFVDEENGWIAGGYMSDIDFYPILLKTTNGSETWDVKKDLNYLINDIWFVNNQHGWSVGCDTYYKGVILESTDGGENWNVVIDNLIGPLNSIFIKDNYAWAVGYNGLILRTTNAGTVWVEDENNTFLTEFKLEQNYPNPFNPTTTIRYSIPNVTLSQSKSNVYVTLKVYDILGREVALLVNEEKLAGSYQVEFNAVNLPSSIYFYRLQAVNYYETKKMVLLK